MSMPPPPDDPTQRLGRSRLEPIAPQPVSPAQPYVREQVVAPGVDPNVILLRLEDAVGSLRTGLAVVGVLAVAAVGVAVYALLKDGGAGTGSRSGTASDARVSQVDQRVDRLKAQLQTLRARSATGASAGSATALDERVAAVERTARTLAARPVAKDATQAIQQLSGRIDTLATDVEQLKQAQSTTP